MATDKIIPTPQIYLETFTCREEWHFEGEGSEPRGWVRHSCSDVPLTDQIKAWVDETMIQITGYSPPSHDCGVEGSDKRIYHLSIAVSYLRPVEGADDAG